MPTQLLAIGDIHLGRMSRRLPANLDGEDFGPQAALRIAVQTARSRRVDAVLLAGDVADSEHDHYVAHGILTDVLQPLVEAGIPVLAVAGNHDHKVLPRLARALPNLQLLGIGGVWDAATINGPGGPVTVLGWSFPGVPHRTSPLGPMPELPTDRPVIGLLHADLDAGDSPYAPVASHELQSIAGVRWLLGHVHRPSLDRANDRPGYLGSLVGLDPTETGPHGPWLVSVDNGRIDLEHLVQAPLYWDRLEVSVDGIGNLQDDLDAHLTGAVRDDATRCATERRHATAVGLRVDLTGRVADYRAIETACSTLTDAELTVRHGSQTLFVDTVTNRTQPMHDLSVLAKSDDPPGLLARELLSVMDGTATTLLDEARARLRQVDNQRPFTSLDSDTPDDTELQTAILHSGYSVLDDLLADPESSYGTP